MAVPGFLFSLVACSEASAAYVGDRYFVSTLATVVPTPADFANIPNVVLLPEVGPLVPGVPGTREVQLPFTYSKLITKDWSIFFTETFRNIEQTTTRSGFDNLVIGTQYEAYSNAEHQFVVTIGGTAAIGGTGSPDIAAEFSTLTPTLYLGKGFGDLPDSLDWLRPLTLSANLAVAIPTEETTLTGATLVTNPDILLWSFAVEYAMLTNVEKNGRRFPLGIVPLVEVALTTPLDGPNAGVTTGTVNPGFIWVEEYFQYGLEAVIPINEASGGIGMRAQIHWYLGNVFPNSLGKPIFDF
jgi:hypothetical protein